MSEANIEIPLILVKDESDCGGVTRIDTEKISFPNGRTKILSRYRRGSTGSCHDICKYGARDVFEAKKESPIKELITVMRDEKLVLETSVYSLRRTKSGVTPKPCPHSETIQKPDNATTRKKNATSSANKDIDPPKKITYALEGVDVSVDLKPSQSPPPPRLRRQGSETKRSSSGPSKLGSKETRASVMVQRKTLVAPTVSSSSKHSVKRIDGMQTPKNLKRLSPTSQDNTKTAVHEDISIEDIKTSEPKDTSIEDIRTDEPEDISREDTIIDDSEDISNEGIMTAEPENISSEDIKVAESEDISEESMPERILQNIEPVAENRTPMTTQNHVRVTSLSSSFCLASASESSEKNLRTSTSKTYASLSPTPTQYPRKQEHRNTRSQAQIKRSSLSSLSSLFSLSTSMSQSRKKDNEENRTTSDCNSWGIKGQVVSSKAEEKSMVQRSGAVGLENKKELTHIQRGAPRRRLSLSSISPLWSHSSSPSSSVFQSGNKHNKADRTSSNDDTMETPNRVIDMKPGYRSRARRAATFGLVNKSSPVKKLKFRKGKVNDSQPEDTSPRRLKFRRTKMLQEMQNGKTVMRKASFKRNEVDAVELDDAGVKSVGSNGRRSSRKEEGDDVFVGIEMKSEKVVLRHHNAAGRKLSRSLFNNVIEETASRLVQTRKSKVKALVGAFETVISLQDTKASAMAGTY